MPTSLPSLWGRESSDLMHSMRQEIDRLTDNFAHRAPATRLGDGLISPRVDVSETENSIEVSAELPGVEEKDIEVDLSGDLLTLRGEKKHEKEEKGEHYRRVERSYGSFERTLTLPYEADPDKVTAKFDKGVLKVSLPKSPEVQKRTRKIAVKGGK